MSDVRKTHRERDTHTHTEKQRDTHRHTHTHTDTHTDTQTHTDTHTHTCSQTTSCRAHCMHCVAVFHETFQEYFPFSWAWTDGVTHGKLMLMNLVAVSILILICYYCFKIDFFVKI